MNQARQTARLPNKDRFKGLEFVGRMTECDAGQEAFATVSRASNWAGSAPNKIARKLIASFRIAANCGNAMQTRISAPSAPVGEKIVGLLSFALIAPQPGQPNGSAQVREPASVDRTRAGCAIP